LKKIIFLVLLLSSLACGLLEKPVSPTAIPTNSNTPSTKLTASTPSTIPTNCKVKTGIEDGGLLNLRAGPGMNYGSIRVLHEGEVILLANIPARDGWQPVTVGSLTGWVIVRYITCEVKP
jgi:uncharacterized protein YraI